MLRLKKGKGSGGRTRKEGRKKELGIHEGRSKERREEERTKGESKE